MATDHLEQRAENAGMSRDEYLTALRRSWDGDLATEAWRAGIALAEEAIG